MSQEIVSDNEEYTIVYFDRTFGGSGNRTVLRVRSSDGAVIVGNLTIDKNGNMSATGPITMGDLEIAADGTVAIAAAVVALPVYSNLTRPLATAFDAGTAIFNSDDNAPNYSNGTSWYDAAGNIT